MGDMKTKIGMGWLRDYPDFRDYTFARKDLSGTKKRLNQKDIRTMLRKVGVAKPSQQELPSDVDLREHCSPIEHQENLGSCTANAGVGLVEYFEKRAFGKHIDASRLFLYKTTRNLMKMTGDTGAYLRQTMAAMTLFGIPPSEYWPYDIESFDEEPPAFCYAFAQNYQALQYYRLDPPGTDPDALLDRIRTYLAGGLPSMFGFTVFSSIWDVGNDGKIPFPTPHENAEGGHAIVAVGYDDKMAIENKNPDGIKTTGALLIRNSWGTGWGNNGYGWLPYRFVLDCLAVDWWSLIKNEWVDTENFKL